MEAATNPNAGVLMIECSDDRAEALFALMGATAPIQTRVTRIREVSSSALEAAAPISMVLLCEGNTPLLDDLAQVREVLPDLPLVTLCEDDASASAPNIIAHGADACLFWDEIIDGTILWRALQHAMERHRLRQALARDAEALRALDASFLDALRATQYERIGILAGGIAHDLNNLLTCLCLNVHFALQVEGSALALREILEDMQKALPRAGELTQQLLSFAKGGCPTRGDADLTELIRDTARFALRGSNVRCDLALPEDLWPTRVDTGPSSQILNNLVVNARQAMLQGGVIHILARNAWLPEEAPTTGAEALRPGPYVHVEVRDQGHGIPADLLERIFEPYFTTRKEGNGLGLAICQSILQALGGRIAVSSGTSGTRFHVYLPARAAHRSRGTQRFPERPRVLFMDDDAFICRVVTRVLEDSEIEVEIARDGFEAIEKAARASDAGRSFDAAVLDVTVPGGMGAERTLPRLRDIDPSLPVLASSASLREPLMQAPHLHGFQGSIRKPYDGDALLRALHEVGVPMPSDTATAEDR